MINTLEKYMNKKFSASYLMYPLVFSLCMWIFEISEIIFNIHIVTLGIFPRTFSGLTGIITAPLVHGSINHLMSNTFPIILLGSGTIYFYKNASKYVLPLIYLLTNFLVWAMARQAYHIGSSGLIYGMVTFLFFSGVIRRDRRSIALALLVTFLYGSLVWGVLPLQNGSSWESHLFGSFVGIACAIFFRKTDPYKKYDWEDEPDSEEPGELRITYDPKDRS